MTTNLRLLIWAALLVVWGTLLLDWRDEVVKLRPERIRLEQLRSKEQSALWNVDWKSALSDAKQAQSQWLSRLPVIEQTGVFRAQALESISDICKQLSMACQVAALGESAVSASVAQTTPTGSKTAPAGLSGLIATGVRVSVPLQDKNLELFMKTLENDVVLRRIDKAIARSARMTLDVQVYGLSTRTPSATVP